MSGFYEVHALRVGSDAHGMAPWREAQVQVFEADQTADLVERVNAWLCRKDVLILAVSPALPGLRFHEFDRTSGAVQAQIETWTMTVVYQQRLLPNGDESEAGDE